MDECGRVFIGRTLHGQPPLDAMTSPHISNGTIPMTLGRGQPGTESSIRELKLHRSTSEQVERTINPQPSLNPQL